VATKMWDASLSAVGLTEKDLFKAKKK